MEQAKKKKLYAGIILFAFLGSTIAFAILSYSGSPQQQNQASISQTIYERPLSESEEIPFLQKNLVVVKYFYSDNCANCSQADEALTKIYQELNGQLLIERINTEVYSAEATVYNVESVPSFYLKGSESKTVVWNGQDLIYDICPLYFSPIYACGLIGPSPS